MVGEYGPREPGSVFTNHSQEHSFSFSPKLCKFESNTTSYMLNHTILRMVGENRPCVLIQQPFSRTSFEHNTPSDWLNQID